jgi:hypothetical protein
MSNFKFNFDELKLAHIPLQFQLQELRLAYIRHLVAAQQRQEALASSAVKV